MAHLRAEARGNERLVTTSSVFDSPALHLSPLLLEGDEGGEDGWLDVTLGEECCFFGGMDQEIAVALRVPDRTVRRESVKARAS